MLYLIDKPKDNWSMLSLDMTEVIFDDGERIPITTDCVKLTFWEKYKGKKLSEVSDTKDLTWLIKIAQEKDEVFCERMFTMRLKELK